jgi:UDPglucose 6-dehydrogenase
VVYDPKVKIQQMLTDVDYLNTRPESDNRNLLSATADAYEACKDAHAIAILTEWDEFKAYDWQKIYNNMMKPAFVFDGRNILDKAKLEGIGFRYFGIGK